MRTRGQPGHRTTTAHIQSAYPFVAEGGLGGRGVYIGRDVYGGSFCYDPWELYGRELTSPNAVVVGIVGRAKSSLVKTYVFRQAVFGRPVDVRQHVLIERKTLFRPQWLGHVKSTPGARFHTSHMTLRFAPWRRSRIYPSYMTDFR